MGISHYLTKEEVIENIQTFNKLLTKEQIEKMYKNGVFENTLCFLMESEEKNNG